MTELTYACAALGKQLAASNPAANKAHFDALDAHSAKLDAAVASDDTDIATLKATVSETRDALQALLTNAKDASSGNGSSGSGGASTGTAPGGTPQS